MLSVGRVPWISWPFWCNRSDDVTIDEHLSATIRSALASERPGPHREVKMFGGIGFMLNGNFVAGTSSRGLLVRVGKDRQSKALAQAGARPMVMRGRTMEGYIYVDPETLDARSVRSWLRLAVTYVGALPSKESTSTRANKQQRARGN